MSGVRRLWCIACALLLCVVIGVGPLGCGKTAPPEDKGEYHYKLAANFFYDKNPQSALEELTRALHYNPNHPLAHHLMGFIFFGRQDYESALHHLQRAVQLNPDLDEAVANLGNLLLAMKQWAAAIPYFERLVAKPVYRTPYLAHNNLGWAHFKLGHLDLAKKHFERAIFFNAKFCLAFNNLGRLQAQEGATKSALKNFHRAIELCQNYSEPHYFLGRIYAALGASARAQTHFSRCHELAPESNFGRRCQGAL